jgi:NhaP-type Na+/H+ or K+/H+ antiporter
MTYFALLVVAIYLFSLACVMLKRDVENRGTVVVIAALPVVAIMWLLYALRLPGWLW